MAVEEYLGTGRRKTSVARVRMKSGSGAFTVNGKTLEEFFPREDHQMIAKRALNVTGNEKKFDVRVLVNGGGITGQAGAILLGVARALRSLDEGHVAVLRENRCLVRDSRMVERKKYGQPGARRRFQFSKR